MTSMTSMATMTRVIFVPHVIVLWRLGRLVMRQVVGATVMPDLLLTRQMVNLVTLALVWRAVALAAWVVVANTHRLWAIVASTV
jgi:hypothetical protein